MVFQGETVGHVTLKGTDQNKVVVTSKLKELRTKRKEDGGVGCGSRGERRESECIEGL